MPTLDNLRITVIATDGVEEPELAEPVRALREAGTRTELLSIKPGQIQAVRHDLQPTQTFAGHLVTSRPPSDMPTFTRETLTLFAAAREA